MIALGADGARRQRLVQVMLGVVWLADGALQLQPAMFGRGLVAGVLLPSAKGNPGPIAGSISAMAHFLQPHIAAWNALFAATQLLIGVGLLVRRTVRPALAVSFAWSLAVWWFAEGLGGLLTGTASPLSGAPGAALLYVLVGLLVWPRQNRDHDPAGGAASGGLLGEVGARAAWAVLWVGSAVLLLQPANLAPGALRAVVLGVEAGQPAWFAGPLASVAGALDSQGTLLTLDLAAVMAVVGIGVALRWHDAPLLGLAAVLALVVWVFGEGLGGVLTGTGTDPSTGPLLMLAAFALYRPGLARDEATGADGPRVLGKLR